jgi:sulfocyanin
MRTGAGAALVAGWLAAATGRAEAQDAGVRQAGAATSIAHTATRRVNRYFAWDSTARVAQLTIVASSDTSNLTLNFNGASMGNLAVEVPTGWTLQVRMLNKGPLRHSALVIEAEGELPLSPKRPVFAGGGIGPIEKGIAHNASGTMEFVASRPGTYGIVCAVPAHAQLGMWVLLVVSDDVQVPSYRLLSAGAATVAADGAR